MCENSMLGKQSRSSVFSVEKLKTVIQKKSLIAVKYIFLYYTVGEEDEKSSSSSSSSKVLWFNMRQVSRDPLRRILVTVLAINNSVIPLQEPIIYVNGIPFAPRAPDNLHANIGKRCLIRTSIE
jgi:hypothetical protein